MTSTTPSAAQCDWLNDLITYSSCLKPTDCSGSPGQRCCSSLSTNDCASKCAKQPQDKNVGQISDCLVYANVSQYLNTSSPSGGNTVALSSLFINNTNEVSSGIGRSYAQCLPKLCDLSTVCSIGTAPSCAIEALLPDQYTISLDSYMACKTAICPPTATLNSEIAGIGILASFILQITLGSFFFLALVFIAISRSSKKTALNALDTLQICETDKSLRKQKGQATVDKLTAALHRLAAAAVAYYKCQGLFIFAVSTSIFWFLHHGTVQLNDVDQQALMIVSLFNLYALMLPFGVSTFVPPTVISHWDFVLSFIGWLLSLCASPVIAKASPDYNALSTHLGDDCEKATVAGFCNRSLYKDMDDTYLAQWAGYWTTIPVTLAIVLRFLFVLEICKDLKDVSTNRSLLWAKIAAAAKKIYSMTCKYVTKAGSATRKQLEKSKVGLVLLMVWAPVYFVSSVIWRFVKIVAIVTCYLSMLGLCLFGMVMGFFGLCLLIAPYVLIAHQVKHLLHITSREWNLGQIFAVIVWTPVAAELITYCPGYYASVQVKPPKSEQGQTRTLSDKDDCACGYCATNQDQNQNKNQNQNQDKTSTTPTTSPPASLKNVTIAKNAKQGKVSVRSATTAVS